MAPAEAWSSGGTLSSHVRLEEIRREAIRTLASAVVLLLAAPVPGGARRRRSIPGPTLSLDGLPPVPSALVEAVRPYAEIRGAAFRSWHPARREMLISTRFGETDQIHLVDRPGGDRRQLTFLPEPIGWASFDPRGGSSFVFSSDTGGDEFFQLYRYDLADGRITLLTDGSKRHFGGPWSNRGDRILFDQVDADAEGAFTEIWVVDPRVPDSKRKVVTLRGGGWGLADWSLDDSQLLLEEQVSAQRELALVDRHRERRQRRVTPDPAAGKVVWSNGRFADDGRSLFVSTNSGGEFRQLALLQIEEGKLEILTPDLPWDVTAVELSPAGSVLAFLTNEGGWSRLYLLDTTTRARRAVGALPAGVASGLRWHENGKELAVSVSSARIERRRLRRRRCQPTRRALDSQRDRRSRSSRPSSSPPRSSGRASTGAGSRGSSTSPTQPASQASVRSSSTSTAAPRDRAVQTFAAPPTSGSRSSASR